MYQYFISIKWWFIQYINFYVYIYKWYILKRTFTLKYLLAGVVVLASLTGAQNANVRDQYHYPADEFLDEERFDVQMWLGAKGSDNADLKH